MAEASDKSTLLKKQVTADSKEVIQTQKTNNLKGSLSKTANSTKTGVKNLGGKSVAANSKAMLLNKKKSNYVAQGQVIGREGGIPGTCGAGLSTGAHLHFETRQNGTAVNPRDYLGRTLIWPINNFRVTQEFGPASWTPWYDFHTGIDLAANYGSPVYAANQGLIIFNGHSNGYGHLIIIDHGSGLRTYYGHLMC